MSDIFISYSSLDKEKADQLSELLASAGLSVWIDRSGLEVSTSWSKEIVQAINECKAFIVLLSQASVESHNVIKEVSLASEKRKKILPLDLEPITLSEDLEYQLAGIQRAPMSNIDSIIRTLAKLGLEATKAPELKLVKESGVKKSLMILPFQDLSPTGDNSWFADGIVSELITALSNVKALSVTDAQTTRDFKRYQGTLPKYAREMVIRYFVEGDVRKFGDQIKITARLLDIETGDHLWQDSMKGTMNDIFDMQEQVAQKVVEGLKVHLAEDERKKLVDRGTESAEAYELHMQAWSFFVVNTRKAFLVALRLAEDATRLDPNYVNAYTSIAQACMFLYRNYTREEELLERAERSIAKALQLKPQNAFAHGMMGHLLMLRGNASEAIAEAKKAIELEPKNPKTHFTLGYIYTDYSAIKKLQKHGRLPSNSNPTTLLHISILQQPTGQQARWSAQKKQQFAHFHILKNICAVNQTINSTGQVILSFW
jgi:TolB-like protein